MEIQKLLKTQQALHEQLSKAITNHKKASKARRTESYYQIRIDTFKSIWSQFLNNHALIYQSETNEAEEYKASNLYEETEDMYIEYLSEFNEELKTFNKTETKAPLPPHTESHKSEVKLPTITIPKFDGTYRSWRSFHDMFKSIVHNDPNLSKVQKFHYLKTCVTGEAERLLRQFDITDQNYSIAWEFLHKRYNNTRILVNTQLKLLLNQHTIKSESSQAIKNLLDQTEECLHELRSLDISTDQWDAILVYIIVQKLPPETHCQWEQEQGNKTNIPSYSDLTKFLESRFRTLEALQECKPNKFQSNGNTKHTYTLLNKPIICAKCKQNHRIYHCVHFNKLQCKQRLQFAQQHQLCKNCLSSGHNITDCLSKKRCSKCQKRHHTLLHLDQPTTQNDTKETMPKPSTKLQEGTSVTPETHAEAFFSSNFKRVLLSTALIQANGPNGEIQYLRALLDSGSQVSFITETACRKLNLNKRHVSMEITGLGKTQTAYATAQVTFKIKSINSTFQTKATALVLKKITDVMPPQQINITNWKHIANLKLADPKFFTPGSIDLLLGADIYAQIINNEIIRGTDGNPTAQNTQLGWILMGQVNNFADNEYKAFTIQVNETQRLEDQLKRFWEQEEIPGKVIHPDDKKCEELYENTHKRLKNGQYEVMLPFREPTGPVLGHSRHIALKQFLQLEKRLEKNKEISIQYKNCINEYLQLQHMEEIATEATQQDPNSSNIAHYYLPHHAVLKESTTTKLRVVFNASAKTSNGKSLNEQLLVGPTIQSKLWALLLKWRMYQFAFTADIEKMYRMIHIHPDHKRFHRILWRNDPKEPIKDYQLTTVTFGTTSAPYLAIRTIHQLAYDEKQNFPLAAQSLLNDFYVDDLLTGAHDITTGIKLQNELIKVLQTAGFNLRKWTANNAQLLQNIPYEHREIKEVLTLSENESIKTLGIQWHPLTDEFSFSVKLHEQKLSHTKRTILSEIASLFDPLGWLAPCIITAKIFIKKLWSLALTWDDPLPDSLANEWDNFKKQLIELRKIKIPRWIQYSPKVKHIQMHGFCDASNQAYAAVIYLRIVTSDENIKVHLLTSKTRVAPTKPVTLPRLELCGALLLAQLVKEVKADMNIPEVPIFAWTDSEIALAWIQGQPTKWKTFIANRVAEIQENIPPSSWRHLSSIHNPADCASRGLQPAQLPDFNIWWKGPNWLQSNEWINNKSIIRATNLEERKVKTFTNTIEETTLLTKYSSFSKLIRVVAYCLRFINNTRFKKDKTRTKYLTVKELQNAEIKVITLLQRTIFTKEYQNLKQNKPISSKSRLLCLNPFLAEDKTIRVGGRLENSSLTYNQKHPIILPNQHHVTNLIIDHIHRYTLHGGTQLVLNTLRNKYWLINARNSIRLRIHKCVTCFRTNPKPNKQIMSSLPTPRVTPSLPFEHTGVDYAGPIDIKTSKIRNAKLVKGYLSIFICLATKAIHIEVVSDLTTAAFMAALRRFVSRRGMCSHIYSDCGTNFIGTQKELEKELRATLNHVPEKVTEMGINWHFNPPSAPHFGGLWEAGVKLIKTHLRKILQKTTLTFEELTTTITQIEACVNSRPLFAMSNDPNDYNVLTPGHFLTGKNLLNFPEQEYDANISTLKRWQYTQYLMQQFWRQWSTQYLHTLQQRAKWRIKDDNLKPDDLVIITNNQYPPSQWPLGRIIKVYHGIDKNVRVAKVQTSQNILTRPITKLCKLPILQ